MKKKCDGGNTKKTTRCKYCRRKKESTHSTACGDALVYGNAEVCGDAQVYGNAEVCGDALVESSQDYITFGPIGSRNDTTTAFKTSEGVKIKCGCFLGSLEEFESAVERTHGESQYGREYKALIELLKLRFGM